VTFIKIPQKIVTLVDTLVIIRPIFIFTGLQKSNVSGKRKKYENKKREMFSSFQF
jgi:hypothetical protein